MRLRLSILGLLLVFAAPSPAKPPDLPHDLIIEFVALRPTEEPLLQPMARECDRVVRRQEPEATEYAVPVLRHRMPTEEQPRSLWQELLRFLDMLRTTEPLGPGPAEDPSF